MQHTLVNRFRLTNEEYQRLSTRIIPIDLKLSDGTEVSCELEVAGVAVTLPSNGARRAEVYQRTRQAQNIRGNMRGTQRTTRNQQPMPNKRGKFVCDVKGCTDRKFDTRRSLGVHKVKAHGIHGAFWQRNQRTIAKRRKA